MVLTSLGFRSPPETEAILELGLTLCPTQTMDTFTVVKYLNLFARRLIFKIMFDKEKALRRNSRDYQSLYIGYKVEDFRAWKTLV